MIFDKYPYTNFHELNDDWIIKVLKEMSSELDEFVAANSLTYADPIAYDPETNYPANTVVIDDNTAYVSKCPVPAGILPTNGDYWLLIFPFGDLIETGINESETALTARIDAYLAAAGAQLETAIDAIPSTVNAWMDAHPEVTTTVQNESITWTKLYTELRNLLLAQYTRYPEQQAVNNSDFEQGRLNGFGNEESATNVCRTGYVYFQNGIIQIRAAIDYIVKMWRYDRKTGVWNGIALGSITTGWNAINVDSDHMYRFTIMAEDQSDITPSDLPLLCAWYYFYGAKLRGENDPLSALEFMGSTAVVDGMRYREDLPEAFFAENVNPQTYADAETYLDGIVNSVSSGKHILFTTDRHYRRDSHVSQNAQQYVRSKINIDRIIFGGDVVNRESTPYLAYQVMNEYFDYCVAAAGAAYLPVFGNHDLNTANTPDADATRMNIGVSADLFTRHLAGYVHFETTKLYGNVTGNDIVTIMQTIVDNKIEADPTILQTLNMTRDEIVTALVLYNQLHYYVDDDINKTRYIVYNTGAPDNIVVQTIFGVTLSQTEIYLQIDWLYETLMSTPIGYDIVLSGHLVTLDPKTTANSYINSTYQYDILAQLSCLKLHASMNTSITSDLAASINQDWTPTARRTLDFTNAPDVGTVIVLAGHWHRDYAVKGYFHRAPTGSGGHYAPGDYKGVLINPDSVVDESAGEILIVGTAADKDMTDQQLQLTGVDAVAFDIVTISDSSVEFKRVGHSLDYSSGNDPGAHTDPITRVFTIS